VAGGAILGDGRLGLILDAAGLLTLVGADAAVTVAA
jgi:chemotaxis protein histidine kinase CheA